MKIPKVACHPQRVYVLGLPSKLVTHIEKVPLHAAAQTIEETLKTLKNDKSFSELDSGQPIHSTLRIKLLLT